MSLYGDLPEAKDSGGSSKSGKQESKTSSAWGAAQLRLQQARRATQLAAPPSVARAGRGRGRGPAAAASDGGGSGAGAGRGIAELGSTFLSSNGAALADEYDPARPNDYSAIRAQRETARREAEREAERQEAMRKAELALQQAHPDQARPSQEELPGPPGGGGPSSLPQAASGEEAYLRRGALGRGGGGAEQQQPGGEARGMGLAAKMMEKMGWRGGGLGREQQGMATPLVAQRKDRSRNGIIVQGDDPNGPPQQMTPRAKGTAIQGKPTKVVLLRNMVGPGQVDTQLEEEVGNECNGKYGPVNGVVIFEVTEPGFPPELAVRIFVSFERQEHAIKAAIDLGGRFFGGREVRATFYDEDRFAANDFAPDPAKGD